MLDRRSSLFAIEKFLTKSLQVCLVMQKVIWNRSNIILSSNFVNVSISALNIAILSGIACKMGCVSHMKDKLSYFLVSSWLSSLSYGLNWKLISGLSLWLRTIGKMHKYRRSSYLHVWSFQLLQHCFRRLHIRKKPTWFAIWGILFAIIIFIYYFKIYSHSW